MKYLMRTMLVCLVLSGVHCNKSKEELRTLPAETQTGANTIGFKVNRDVWTTNGRYCPSLLGGCRNNPEAGIDRFLGGQLYLTADRVVYKGVTVKSSESFQISIWRNFNRAGIYRLSGIDSLHQVRLRRNLIPAIYELIPNKETFQINITSLDTTNKIVSGLFSGILYRREQVSDSIIISEGRFDMKYY